MSCTESNNSSSSSSDSSSGIQEMQRRKIDHLARMLCFACRKLEEAKIPLTNNRELSIWWREHKVWDKRRTEEEHKRTESRQIVASIMKRLTPKERQALKNLHKSIKGDV